MGPVLRLQPVGRPGNPSRAWHVVPCGLLDQVSGWITYFWRHAQRANLVLELSGQGQRKNGNELLSVPVLRFIRSTFLSQRKFKDEVNHLQPETLAMSLD